MDTVGWDSKIRRTGELIAVGCRSVLTVQTVAHASITGIVLLLCIRPLYDCRSQSPQLAGTDNRTTAKAVVCGPTSKPLRSGSRIVLNVPPGSVVIDRNDRFLMAGKWKATGEGGNGAPYTTFRSVETA